MRQAASGRRPYRATGDPAKPPAPKQPGRTSLPKQDRQLFQRVATQQRRHRCAERLQRDVTGAQQRTAR